MIAYLRRLLDRLLTRLIGRPNIPVNRHRDLRDRRDTDG